MAKKFNHRIWPITILVLAAALPGDAAFSAAGPRAVEGQVFAGGMSVDEMLEAARPRRLDVNAPIGLEMKLEPMAEPAFREKADKSLGGPLMIGDNRELPAAFRVEKSARELGWEDAREGGQVAVFTITSPGAKSIRAAIDFHRVPRGAEVRFYSRSDPSDAVGPFEAKFLAPRARSRRAAEPFWSPIVGGDTMVVEVWVPRWRRGSDVRFSLREVGHIYHELDGKDLRDLGSSGSCNKDVDCFGKWVEAGKAVAKYAFSSGGGVGLRTGQLLANADGKLLFLTAGHCVNTRFEAASATFFWFFKRAGCKGPNPTAVVQTSGGGKLLFENAGTGGRIDDTDHSLWRLKRNPPNGVNQLGWVVNGDPDDNVRAKVHSIHHPGGDVKRASRGKIQDTLQVQANGDLLDRDPPTHYEVQWSRGTTEPGSSGGAVVTGKRWPRQFVVGVLSGGAASCSAKRAPDFYGIFEETFRRFRKFSKHFD